MGRAMPGFFLRHPPAWNRHSSCPTNLESYQARKNIAATSLNQSTTTACTMSSRNTLSAASEDRKARLAKLKNLKRKQPTDELVAPEADTRSPNPADAAQDEEAPPDVTHLHLSGRNYDPETRGPKLGFDAPPMLADDKTTLEEQAAELEAQVKEQAATEAAEDKGIDLFKLQPKKPNWDLKRNLEQKMDVLNVRTDNAIARLVKDRITAAQKAAEKDSDGTDVEAAGMDGATLVESLRVREQEEEEEERRERAEDEALTA